MLSIVLGKSEERGPCGSLGRPFDRTWSSSLEGSYKFVHDRVQEAAYSLIPEAVARRGPSPDRKAAGGADAHRRSGKRPIFEIVNQLNRGAALITSREEREQLAELNLIAGQRAKATTAYASALTYLTAGEALLPDVPVISRQHEKRIEMRTQPIGCRQVQRDCLAHVEWPPSLRAFDHIGEIDIPFVPLPAHSPTNSWRTR